MLPSNRSSRDVDADTDADVDATSLSLPRDTTAYRLALHAVGVRALLLRRGGLCVFPFLYAPLDVGETR